MSQALLLLKIACFILSIPSLFVIGGYPGSAEGYGDGYDGNWPANFGLPGQQVLNSQPENQIGLPPPNSSMQPIGGFQSNLGGPSHGSFPPQFNEFVNDVTSSSNLQNSYYRSDSPRRYSKDKVNNNQGSPHSGTFPFQQSPVLNQQQSLSQAHNYGPSSAPGHFGGQFGGAHYVQQGGLHNQVLQTQQPSTPPLPPLNPNHLLGQSGFLDENRRKAIVYVWNLPDSRKGQSLISQATEAGNKYDVPPQLVEVDVKKLQALKDDAKNYCNNQIIARVYRATVSLTNGQLELLDKNVIGLKLYRSLKYLGLLTLKCLIKEHEDDVYFQTKQNPLIEKWLKSLERARGAAGYGLRKEFKLLDRNLNAFNPVVLAAAIFFEQQRTFDQQNNPNILLPTKEQLCGQVLNQFNEIGSMMRIYNSALFPKPKIKHPVLVIFGALYDFCLAYSYPSQYQAINSFLAYPQASTILLVKLMNVLGPIS